MGSRRNHFVRGKRVRWVYIVGLCVLTAIALPATASAAAKLWKTGELGSGPGQTLIPRGVAADPNLPGHIFVADQGNNRIDEFNPWGLFVKAWGWGVRTGSAEPQVCTTATGCRKGLEGDGVGQFDFVQGVAVDSEGNVYAYDLNNARVQKFNPDGDFLLMFGGGVDQGPSHPGDICTVATIADGDSCGAGSTGTGAGEFDPHLFLGSFLAIGSGDEVYVGDNQRIEKFASDGTFVEDITSTALTAGGVVKSLAVDESNDFYVVFEGKERPAFQSGPDVLKLDSSGVAICTMKVPNPTAVGTAEGGSAYAIDRTGDVFPTSAVEQFNSNCINQNLPFGADELTHATGLGAGSACLSAESDIYVTGADLGELGRPPHNFLRAYGPAPDDPACPPPAKAPTIDSQFATSVSTDVATARAHINPHFWKDTSFYVEYGIGECSAGNCTQTANFPGIPLQSGIVDEIVVTPGVLLSGLQAGKEYHYRFVAKSSGGGPVYGGDPDGDGPGEPNFAAGVEATFTTIAPPASDVDACSNAAMRQGRGTRLADCRAYEMVSPIDKQNSDILVLKNVVSFPARRDRAASSGEKLTYSSYRAFGDAESSPYTSQYLATRGGSGWENHGISPVREGPGSNDTTATDSEFKAFSDDLSLSWIVHFTEPLLAPGAAAGFENLYRRSNASGIYTTMNPGTPQTTSRSEFHYEMQGASADGSHTVFRANDNGPPEFKESEMYQVYDSVDGAVSAVCVLPNETLSKQRCSAGSPNIGNAERSASLDHAVSEDGSRIFWSNIKGNASAGKLYVRIDGVETVAVSDAVNPSKPPEQAQFWTAAGDGSKAIFTVGEGLYEFDVESRIATPIATGVTGVAGASDDASRIYFVSKESLGDGPGPEAGKENLYLYEAGEPPAFTYVATLAALDVEPGALSLVAREPLFHAARVSPSGSHLAFMSTASLTGKDNIDANSGQADSEVFIYDADSDDLLCVSCNRTGARPSGRNVEQELRLTEPFWVSAQLPTAESQVNSSRLLSEDGSRLFFESLQPLDPVDTNGMRDVYEWEAQGAGTCDVATPSFNLAAGGCINLISGGESPQDSELIDTSADGSDVFFTTASSLVPQDPGLIDVYDARVNGGFPPAPLPPGRCDGEACQAAPVVPNDSSPSSSTFSGPENPPVSRPKKKKCPKGRKSVKRNGVVRCLKKSEATKRKADKSGRASR
jgi:hypothetical protein